ncbi:MAG: PKD domain-containing protein [Myxococcota bacterium]|nr:PKD domain-containing protein [Myxococcota bacterium]
MIRSRAVLLSLVSLSVAAAPETPTNVQVSPNPCGTGTAQVTWDGSLLTELSRYDLRIVHEASGTETTINTLSLDSLYIFDPQPGVTTVTVIAVDLQTNRYESTPVSLLTDETPPPPPGEPTVKWNLATGTALVSWPQVVDAETSVGSYGVKVVAGDGETNDFLVNTHSFTFAPPSSGNYTFSISAVDAVGNSSGPGPSKTVALPPAPPSALTFLSGPDSGKPAGTPLNFVLAAVDGAGAPTAYIGTVQFGVTGGVAALLPDDYTFTEPDSGQHAFDGQLRFDAPGSYLLVVRDLANPALEAQVQLEVLPEVVSLPVFLTEPNPTAAVGVAYQIDADGRVSASGGGTLVYATCGTPPAGFGVDATSGAVSWTPTTAAAVFNLCLRATNESGTTELNFQVTVSATAVEVVARLTAAPAVARAPAAVTLDASTSTTSGSVLAYRWRFGDGARAETEAPTVSHSYGLPGSYTAEVTVLDAQGTASHTSTRIQITDQEDRLPPSVKITASTLTGEGSAEIFFGCECTGSSGLVGYGWDLGTGETATGATLTRSFGPGRYQVRLVVVDANGLTGSDTVEVVVNGPEGQVPPSCSPSLAPPSGLAPLGVAHHANAEPGSSPLEAISWQLADGAASGASVSHTYQEPGWYQVQLKVKDTAGLACHATAQVVVIASAAQVPPVFMERYAERQAVCGTDFGHQPVVVGGSPRSFSLGPAPQGMTIDPATGRVAWRPAPWQAVPDASSHVAELIVSVGGASASQTLNLAVTPCVSTELGTCGCGASGAGGPLIVLVALLLWRRRSLRR